MGLKWRNAGQACISANRVYVQSGAYDNFVSIIKERTSKLVAGHGSDPASTLGPVTTPQGLDRALGQVQDARKCGAKILLGGERLKSSRGFFLQPTIVGDAKREMRTSDEESFAPILTLYRFTSEEEAVRLANDTPVGLILRARSAVLI
jgi:acyl-CoA reductase-like NAD-dependent aldehyde dehydrogenase